MRVAQPGDVDLKRLSQKHGDTEFLGNLIAQEVGEPKDKPDAGNFRRPQGGCWTTEFRRRR